MFRRNFSSIFFIFFGNLTVIAKVKKKHLKICKYYKIHKTRVLLNQRRHVIKIYKEGILRNIVEEPVESVQDQRNRLYSIYYLKQGFSFVISWTSLSPELDDVEPLV